MTPHNLAARAGRWSAQHRRTAILGWIAFVIAAVSIGGTIGTKKIESWQGTGESQHATRVIERSFPRYASEQVLVQSSVAKASDAPFRAAVNDVIARVNGVRFVTDVRSPYSGAERGGISGDGRSALVQFRIDGTQKQVKDRVGAALAATSQAAGAHPGFRIEEAGDASAGKALDKSFSDDFNRAGQLSLPITLIILILAFGALVAAGIPVLLSISGVAATLGLIAIPSQIAAVDPAISEVVLLIGMAVGVDYSLFYLRREREERAKGHSAETALDIAAATSGRSVLISGVTVMAAMAGMFFTGDPTFSSIAGGTVIVVAVAMIASVTVLPALLSLLGDRVMKGRVPFIARRREASGEGRTWSAVVDGVLRRPVASVVVSGGLLVALAIPALSLHTAWPGLQGLPDKLAIVKTLDRIQTAFPGGPQPASVVVQSTEMRSSGLRTAIASMESRALAEHIAKPPFTVLTSRDGSVSVVTLPLAGGGTDRTSSAALERLRSDVLPATLDRVPGVRADVTGAAAQNKDFNDLMQSRAPLVFAFVLTMAFLLLLVTFRSIVIPLKAILLNLLSVGASYGVLVLVFQHHWAESLLGFKSTGGITSWLPLFLFVILFGLSMDYHVFILSRIREAFDRGERTEDAVAHGIKSTAGVVTSAAIVMVAVFAVFATLGALEFKQMGVGLAAAILIDATIVRAVLLPATMKLLGDWNWYLPKRLSWLPRVSHEPQAVQPPRSQPQPARA